MRKLAEWISLTISALLLIAVAGFLVYEMFQPRSDFVDLDIKVQSENRRGFHGGFVLPVIIRNRSHQAVTQLELQLSSAAKDEEPIKIIIDYLGGRTDEKIFVFVKLDPQKNSFSISPTQYRID